MFKNRVFLCSLETQKTRSRDIIIASEKTKTSDVDLFYQNNNNDNIKNVMNLEILSLSVLHHLVRLHNSTSRSRMRYKHVAREVIISRLNNIIINNINNNDENDYDEGDAIRR